jgi:hypothetical protein
MTRSTHHFVKEDGILAMKRFPFKQRAAKFSYHKPGRMWNSPGNARLWAERLATKKSGLTKYSVIF